MARNLSRSEHINIMAVPEMDCGLRVLALLADTTVTAVVRKALEEHFKDNAVYQSVIAYVKALRPEQYADLKMKLQDTSLPPAERIPVEIKELLLILEVNDD